MYADNRGGADEDAPEDDTAFQRGTRAQAGISQESRWTAREIVAIVG